MNPAKFSVENPVPSNIIMMLILIGGIYYAFNLVRELFPETNPQMISINTIYQGSSPEEVERGITVKIEDKLKSLEGVETMFSTSHENGSIVTLELEEGYGEVDRLLDEVKAEVDKITDLPEEAEKPKISLVEPLLPVIALSIYGDVSEERLRKLGIKARDEVLVLDGITNVELTGVRNREIAVEVTPESLYRYHLSFRELYQSISQSNLDLSGGKLTSAEREMLVRTVGEVYTARELGEVVVRHSPSGTSIPLRRVANVKESLEENQEIRRYNGKRSVNILVFKTPDQDALEVSHTIKDYAKKLKREIPSDIKLEIHSDLSKYINQRLDLLRRNGQAGLVLVFLSLVLFLNVVLALWAAIGLAIAFLGTFILMKVMGVTINLISMFALIVVLGMLVDDAIIVGENIYRHMEDGKDAITAAIEGAREVTLPVTAAILTTISAFLPLLMMEGYMGQFLRVLPLVVTCALAVSLFESLVILPSHLAESLNAKKIQASARRSEEENLSWWRRLRLQQLYLLNVMGREKLGQILRKILPYRYVVVFGAICITIIVIAAGYVLVPFVINQKMDADTVALDINMPVGTPLEKTQGYISQIEPHFVNLPEMKNVSTLIGLQVAISVQGMDITGNTPDKAQVFIELKEPGERSRTSFDIINELRQKLNGIPGPESIKFRTMQGGPQGQDIEIELRGDRYETLKGASNYLKKRLATYEGVYDIGDDFRLGKKEFQIRLKEAGRALGLTVRDIATQIRAAIYGQEADSFYRQKEEVKVMVRYPQSHRRGIWNLSEMRITTPQGGMVPLEEVASIEMSRSLQSIKRTNQSRTITVLADVDYKENTPSKIMEAMAREKEKIARDYPGVTMRFKGAKLEAQKSINSLVSAFLISIILIYSILASQFHSYIQPLVIMFALPFAIVGAIVGHIVMGYVMTVLSLVGIVALAGIVVNDSLVLVDFINTRIRQQEMEPLEAVIEASKLRMRPILLTSVTTILGLAPLMLETSMQAKFLIPMAISLTFGLAFATVLTLVIIPCFYLIVKDGENLLSRMVAILKGNE